MKITVNDIMNFMLTDYTDYEPDGDIMRFYLYLKNGSITHNHDEADMVITEDIDISRWMDDDNTERFEEEFFDSSNDDFIRLCRWMELKAENNIRTYKIKPEYYEDFGSEADEDTVIDLEEIQYFARGWGKSIGEVLNMLEPCNS